MSYSEAVFQRCSVKKGVLENFANFTEKHLGQNLFSNKLKAQACIFIKKGPLVQVFSSGFCEIFKNTFFTEHLWTTASGYSRTLFHGYLLYHFTALPETWMFIQCSRDFHLWTVAKGKPWHFLEFHILNKSFQQNSNQSSVVT